MKKSCLAYSLLLLVTLLPACTGEVTDHAGMVTPQTFFSHIEFLAGDDLKGRLPGTEGCRKAADYIAAQMKKAGLQPKGDGGTFFQAVSWELDAKEVKSRNVIGIIPGVDAKLKNEAVLVMAHYDHIGNGAYGGRAENRGKIHPGADDNASGVAGLIEAARFIGKSGVKHKRTLIFLATTGEEIGLKGAVHYVKNPAFPLEKTMAVINLDQIGRCSGKVAAMGVHMAKQFDAALDKGFENSSVEVLRQNIAGRGDNIEFNKKHIPSIFFWTGYGDDYHTPSDTADKIKKEEGAELVRCIIRAVRFLADAEKIESRFRKTRGQ